MGGVLSSYSAATPTTQTTPAQQTTVDEPKPTDTTQTTPTLPVEIIHQTVTEPVNEPIAPITTEVKPEEVSAPKETKLEEVLERYVEPTGTKVEVAPVEVAPAVDVVKKTKKKHKKNH
jgi:hypothetical protein